MWIPACCSGFPSVPEQEEELTNTKTQKPIKSIKHTKSKKNIKPHKPKKTNINHKNQKQNSTLTMFSANADGLSRKMHSLKHQLEECNAAIFTIQETQFRKKGRFKFKDYEVFEAIR